MLTTGEFVDEFNKALKERHDQSETAPTGLPKSEWTLIHNGVFFKLPSGETRLLRFDELDKKLDTTLTECGLAEKAVKIKPQIERAKKIFDSRLKDFTPLLGELKGKLPPCVVSSLEDEIHHRDVHTLLLGLLSLGFDDTEIMETFLLHRDAFPEHRNTKQDVQREVKGWLDWIRHNSSQTIFPCNVFRAIGVCGHSNVTQCQWHGAFRRRWDTWAMDSYKKLTKDTTQRRLSCIIKGRVMAEQIYDGTSKFAIYDADTDTVRYANDFDEYLPNEGEEIEKGYVLLPSAAIEYDNDSLLDEEIKSFIRRWLDVPEDFLQFSLWNIKRSWVYDRFHSLNYLRALGDLGKGKSRLLDVLGYVHYKCILTAGATTGAPLFRIIDKWRGTIAIDEGDLRKDTDETNTIVKIINSGFERGRPIMRCNQENFADVDFFDPYCPKLIATRKPFDDKAVESRCITHIMMGTVRKDIPRNLTDKFKADALLLRNKLLMWRFRNYFKINPAEEVDLGLDIEPRVEQIVSGYTALFAHDKVQLEMFKTFVMGHQERLIEERRESWEGRIVEAIANLLRNTDAIDAEDIIHEAGFVGKDGSPYNPRALSTPLKTLGLKPQKPRKVNGQPKRCIPIDTVQLESLFRGYGVTDVTIVTESMLGGGKRVFVKDKEKVDAPRNDRNNRNSVTEDGQQVLT